MQPKDLMAAITVGSVLIVLGLVPGLLSGLKDGIRNFRFPFLVTDIRYRNYEEERFTGQIWLAIGGMALILISVFAYLSK